MNALKIEPNYSPYLVKITDDDEKRLEELQKHVGGYIEVTYPFPDEVGIVCNEEDKINGMPLNRALYYSDGDFDRGDDPLPFYDIISGPFLVVGLTDEGFRSLTDKEMAKFTERFLHPEAFVNLNGRLVVIAQPCKEAPPDGMKYKQVFLGHSPKHPIK